jgi:hypothetical protein
VGFETPLTVAGQPAVSEQTDGITVTCTDNEGGGANACDRDTTPYQRTFLAFYCLKKSPLDSTSCSPRAISRVALLAATTLDPAAQSAVLDSFSSTMIKVGGAGTVGAVTPAAGELAAIGGGAHVPRAHGDDRAPRRLGRLGDPRD